MLSHKERGADSIELEEINVVLMNKYVYVGLEHLTQKCRQYVSNHWWRILKYLEKTTVQ